MLKKTQANYDKIISAIEKNSCYKFSAGTDTYGAYLIPVDKGGIALGTPFYVTWAKLIKLARTVKKIKRKR